MQQLVKVAEIKQAFFTYRNGIIADTLRMAGDCHKTIFGLNLPQIKAIACNYSKNNDLAWALWANKQSRECRMIAPFLFTTEISICDAQKIIDDIENYEIADNICMVLLRNLPYANDLIMQNIKSDIPMHKYVAYRLALNLQIIQKLNNEEEIITYAQIELNETKSRQIQQIILSLIDKD